MVVVCDRHTEVDMMVTDHDHHTAVPPLQNTVFRAGGAARRAGAAPAAGGGVPYAVRTATPPLGAMRQ
eukprot:6957138-Prymnesium_polylepis.1